MLYNDLLKIQYAVQFNKFFNVVKFQDTLKDFLFGDSQIFDLIVLYKWEFVENFRANTKKAYLVPKQNKKRLSPIILISSSNTSVYSLKLTFRWISHERWQSDK